MDTSTTPRRFDFESDRFSFANELLWEYRHDPVRNRMYCHPRQPRPDYHHRCFVLVRAVRQFFYHARFDPAQPRADASVYRRLVRKTLRRDPRQRAAAENQLVIPGYANLRDFSAAWADLIKQEGGGAWRSYVLRSHWRMVFPISRRHQEESAAILVSDLRRNIPPIIHLVRFPALTMNHGMLVFAATERPEGIEFLAYDPNGPAQPARLQFDRATRTFTLPATPYWIGGKLDIIPIYRSWWM